VPSSEASCATAATAASVFLALLVGPAAVALAALVASIRDYAARPWQARAAGIGPAVVLGAVLV